MIIKIDEKEIAVTNPNKNIVKIGAENGITIIAPCFRSKAHYGCCKVCVIEIDGMQKFACGTKPQAGMNVIYNREDLATIRKERLKEYAQRVKNNDAKSDSCCGAENTAGKDQSCC